LTGIPANLFYFIRHHYRLYADTASYLLSFPPVKLVYRFLWAAGTITKYVYNVPIAVTLSSQPLVTTLRKVPLLPVLLSEQPLQVTMGGHAPIVTLYEQPLEVSIRQLPPIAVVLYDQSLNVTIRQLPPISVFMYDQPLIITGA
jgi:hypothetical protein